MKNTLIVLLVLGTLSFSCSNSTSSDELERISLPLEIGNSWTYNVVITNHQENPITTRQETDITFTAQSDTLINEVRWFYIESGIKSYDVCKAGYYSNQDDGIYFVRSFKSSGQEKISNEVFTIGNALSNTELATNGEIKKSPFLHNPDNEAPDRLIKTDNVIASVTYKGESINDDFNTISQDYVWNHYQTSIGTRVFPINPFDLNYSVSSEEGFTIFEHAYASTKGSTEDDPRLQLLIKYRFELTEFSKK